MSKAVQFLNQATTGESPQMLILRTPSESRPSNEKQEHDPPEFDLILSGSFNPLHAGHVGMANFASHMYSASCWFELTLFNADKGIISEKELDARLTQDFQGHGIVLSTAARFCDKSAVFPGAKFVLGADTIIRLADPMYYGDSQHAMLASFSKIAEHDCSFLVFGRKITGQFRTSTNLELPNALIELCQFVEESDFAMDISSTQLRNKKD